MAIELYNDGVSQCVKFDDLIAEGEIPANQFLIAEDKRGFLIDPGGNKLFSKLSMKIAKYCPPQRLDYIFLSHQDPDVGAGLNGWLLITDAKILVSKLWIRFIPNFCTKTLTDDRMIPIPDEGCEVPFADRKLRIIPSHFLHSPGHFHVYEPKSKILFSGDLGVAVGAASELIQTIEEFNRTVPLMNGFYSRYMPHSSAGKRWLKLVRDLDIEMIVPQHGSRFVGKDVIQAFYNWVDTTPGYLG